MNEIDILVENYYKWLKDKTVVRNIDENWTEITTPYLDRHNDYLQIYAKKKDDTTFFLTDDGYIINDLEMSGCSLDKSRRQELLKIALNGFGVGCNENKLFVNATKDNFAEKKHSLIQAMIAINDLFYTAYPYTQSLFWEDVVSWLDSKDIRYIQDVQFAGKSGLCHKFDFSIPKSKKYSERLVQTISNPTKETAQNLIFKWFDTKENRSQSTLFAFLNDTEKEVSATVNDALENYGIKIISWKNRNDYGELLAS
mgnify:CR=1 FL=1